MRSDPIKDTKKKWPMTQGKNEQKTAIHELSEMLMCGPAS